MNLRSPQQNSFLHLRCQFLTKKEKKFFSKKTKQNKNTTHKLHNTAIHEVEIEWCWKPLPPFSGMNAVHEVSEGMHAFLPPYFVHRFALWSFL